MQYANEHAGQVRDARDAEGFGVSHYSTNVHALGGTRRRTKDDFPDGLSETILLGEAAGNYTAWGSPTNWRDPSLGLGQSPDGFGGPWSGNVTIVTFGDNHVRILSNDIDPEVLRALSTPDGGETVNLDNLE